MIKEIQSFLFEQDFKIFPAASWFRRNELDFIAVPDRLKDGGPPRMLAVQPTAAGNIVIRPYREKERSLWTKQKLRKRSVLHSYVRWSRQLIEVGDWRDYIPKKYHRELDLLVT